MGKQRALEGCRVVDIGQVWAGPLAGQILADMGAEVIYVESERHRGSAMMRVVEGEEWLNFNTIGRNKLGVSLDLTTPSGIKLFKALVCISDVVITNSAPGAIESWGINYPTLRAVRPDLIMATLSAAGQTGPLNDLLAYGPGMNVVSGVDSTLGYYGERELAANFEGDPDPGAGMMAAFLITVAMHHRERTGLGQHIDLSFWENQSSQMAEAIMDYTMNGRVASPQGHYHPRMTPHGNYPCLGDDRWVSIGVETEEEWQALCHAMGYPSWVHDNRFLDSYVRGQNDQELDGHIASWTREHSPEEVRDKLNAAGVACFPVLSLPELYSDPHEQYQQQSVLLEHPGIERDSMIYGIPWRLSDTPGSVRLPQPELGQHNDYIFGTLMGVSTQQMAQLVKERVIT